MSTKKEQNKTEELLLSIRNLLILQLNAQNMSILNIVKAAKIRTNDIYKIIPKTKIKKINKSKTEK